MNSAVRERIKTIVIILLAITGVALGMSSGIFDDLSSAFTVFSGQEQLLPPTGGIIAEAARPCLIVVTNSVGERLSARYDDLALDTLYDKTGSIFGEALASAGELEPCTEADWRAALAKTGILFEYPEPMRLDLIQGWLGAAASDWSETLTLRRLCLLIDEDVLYFQAESGYFTAHAASLGARPAIPGAYGAGLRYEFENDPASPAPYAMALGVSAYAQASASNPLEGAEAQKAVLTILGVPGQLRPYTDSDGAHYVTNSFTLSVTPAGMVSYRRTETRGEQSVTLGEACETARRALEPYGKFFGTARLYCSSAEMTGNRSVLTFDYYIAGTRIFLPGLSAARVTLVGGQLWELTIWLRCYTHTQELIQLLPEKQALAVAGGEIALAYADVGGAMLPFWQATGK